VVVLVAVAVGIVASELYVGERVGVLGSVHGFGAVVAVVVFVDLEDGVWGQRMGSDGLEPRGGLSSSLVLFGWCSRRLAE
jgi:hypothetical protein